MTKTIETLEQVELKGQFDFTPNDILSRVVNVPTGKIGGVYLAFANEVKFESLIYAGISGQIQKGLFKLRNDGLRGRFLTGKQFGQLRKSSWPLKIKEEGFDKIIIKWYVTYDHRVNLIPREYESMIIQEYKSNFGKRPLWNKED